MTEQKKLWQGEFGTEYVKRNVITEEQSRARRLLWDNIIKNIYFSTKFLPTTFLEVGAGIGANLMAINEILTADNMPKASYSFSATEINPTAIDVLKFNVPGINLLDTDKLNKFTNSFDLVFTSGVLIHIHPAHRMQLMRNIYHASRRFVIAIEYFAPETRGIKYRGVDNALWLDDYGSIYLDNFGLRLISYGFCWKKVTGLDNVTYWIFEKTN